jgi:hypothetical protein
MAEFLRYDRASSMSTDEAAQEEPLDAEDTTEA